MKHACLALALVMPLGLVGCGTTYSANEYAVRAVQQANRVNQGVIVGFRRIEISAEGTTGAAAGGAAGGVLGAAVGGNRVTNALGAVGGALVGGLIGSAAERAANSNDGIEYVVRKTNGDLVSVTQRDLVPLPVGAHVLVIEGAQARIVADYTVPAETPAPTAARVDGPRRRTDPVPAPAPAPTPAPAAETPAPATEPGGLPAVAAPAPAPAAAEPEAPATPSDPGTSAGVAPAQVLQALPEWLRNQPAMSVVPSLTR
ncbi:hypothetical protein [Rhodovarius lipocyclicus]|uniref:hypothetical protein n=1 Tax=Rhodovarius lipocyclicus TaxID=268410 RepID=UPI00135A4C95|nr:hypothetical protein [Rhodovarius lipocyclicus]